MTNCLQEGQSNKDNLTDTVKLQVELKDLLKDQANALVFTRGQGTGNLYYTAYLSATLPVEEIQPLDQGMSLSREYFTLDNLKKPITEIKRGELVKVRLTVVVPEAVHYVVIEDPLPAGMEAWMPHSPLTRLFLHRTQRRITKITAGAGGISVTSNCAMRRLSSRQITYPLELTSTPTSHAPARQAHSKSSRPPPPSSTSPMSADAARAVCLL